jgi:hypothetical protein
MISHGFSQLIRVNHDDHDNLCSIAYTTEDRPQIFRMTIIDADKILSQPVLKICGLSSSFIKAL